MRTILVLLAAAGLAAGGVVYYRTQYGAAPPANFRTVTVKRGDLQFIISASGTVQAEEFVDVGTQVVGRILDFGIDPKELKGRKPAPLAEKLAKVKRVDARTVAQQKDPAVRALMQSVLKEAGDCTVVHQGPKLAYFVPDAEMARLKRVDYRTVVHKGTELAYIDDAVYQAQLAQAEAAVTRAEADLEQLKAKRNQAAADWQRAQRLRPDRAAPGQQPASDASSALAYRAMSDSDYDLAKANYEVAVANVLVGERTIEQAKAARDLAQQNVDYTTIVSLVEGTIIDRRVNVGQTVVSSLNAPSLFLIAKDLKRMQVWAQVSEADIGRIREGMPARFTVENFPGEVFPGTVTQIRLNAQFAQNVVTYPVVVTFDNPNGKIYPYLTANVQFEVERRSNVLLVPNVALRWKPRPEQVDPEVRRTASAVPSGKGGGDQGPPAATSLGDAKSAKAAKELQDRGRVWEKVGSFVRPVEVQIGASDGSTTEVSGPQVQEGMEVVVGEVRPEQAGEDAASLFAPKIVRGGQKSKE
jgi:HlyD family secretion protein